MNTGLGPQEGAAFGYKRRRLGERESEEEASSSSSSSESEDVSYRPQVKQSNGPVDYAQAGLRKRDRRQLDDAVDSSKEEEEEPVAEVLPSDGEMEVDETPVAEVLPSSSEDEDEAELRRRRKRAERDVSLGNVRVVSSLIHLQAKLAPTAVDSDPSGKRWNVEGEQDEAAALLEDADHSSSASSADDSDGPEEDRLLLKPTFRQKDQRVALMAVMEEEARQAEEEAERARKVAEEKQKESRELLKRTIEESAAAAEAERVRKEIGQETWSDNELPDDEISDEDAAYEAWKLRELGRLRRDYMKEVQRLEEEANIERRRLMTEEERRLDDAKLDSAAPSKAVHKGRMNFMQKYYHKGAFFQEPATGEEEVTFRKDFAAPVPEDAVDKSLLPAIMQVRRGDWGKKGRSKHTHLRDVDTTDRTAAWSQQDVFDQQRGKMGGLKGAKDDLDRPSSKRK